MQSLQASALDAFVALHDYVWHYSGGESTSDLAEHLASSARASGWRGSVIYATRFHPSLANTDAAQLSSSGSLGPHRILTLDQGYQAAVKLVSIHNAVSPTEVWWFAQYLDSDPAAWPDWLTCVQGVLSPERG